MDLRALYRDMWAWLGDDEEIYRKEAAGFLGLMLSSYTLSDTVIQSRGAWRLNLRDLVLVSDEKLTDALIRGDSASVMMRYGEIVYSRCKPMARRVETRCAGLLELGRDYKFGEPLQEVVFLHRSAKEFLEHDEGRKILLHCEAS